MYTQFLETMKTLVSRKYYNSQERDFSQEDILKKTNVYQALDWTKAVVGGSYALQQFTGDKWESNDVDIFVSCDTKEEFDTVAEHFKKQTGSRLLKTNILNNISESNGLLDTKYGWNEDFNRLIKETKTYNMPSCEKPVQLIYLDGTKPTDQNEQSFKSNVHPIEILQETTDLPSCVSYTVVNGDRMFHIPERCREALFTRVVKPKNPNDICGERVDKYQKRGYSFDKNNN